MLKRFLNRVLNRLVRVLLALLPRPIFNAIETQTKRLAYNEQPRQIASGSFFGAKATVSVEQIPANETGVTLKVADSFNAAKQRQSMVPKEYLPSHEWKRILEAEWSRYHDALLNKDVKTLAPFLRNFPDAPVAELDAPRIGNPWGYNFSGMVLLEPVFEYHFQADYFRKLLRDIDVPIVLEIGGGFGALACHLL